MSKNTMRESKNAVFMGAHLHGGSCVVLTKNLPPLISHFQKKASVLEMLVSKKLAFLFFYGIIPFELNLKKQMRKHRRVP